MADKNGKNRWLHWTVGVIFLLLTTWLSGLTNNVIANDKASRDRDSCIVESISNNQIDIVQRLTRIETKLEKE